MYELGVYLIGGNVTDQSGDLRVCQGGYDAGEVAGWLGIDGDYAGVGMGATEESAEKDAGGQHVVHVGALALNQAGVFESAHTGTSVSGHVAPLSVRMEGRVAGSGIISLIDPYEADC